ncbi:hypothetical protein FQZ97_953000 [compost metagenome]
MAKLNAALNQVLKQPQMLQQLTKLGFETETSTPEALKGLMDRDLTRWNRVVTEHKIKVEM